jgi:hypothetical protein
MHVPYRGESLSIGQQDADNEQYGPSELEYQNSKTPLAWLFRNPPLLIDLQTDRHIGDRLAQDRLIPERTDLAFPGVVMTTWASNRTPASVNSQRSRSQYVPRFSTYSDPMPCFARQE